jgi:hypothetical protein
MPRACIRFRVHRYRANAQPTRGRRHPAGNLAAICDQYLVEHRLTPVPVVTLGFVLLELQLRLIHISSAGLEIVIPVKAEIHGRQLLAFENTIDIHNDGFRPAPE